MSLGGMQPTLTGSSLSPLFNPGTVNTIGAHSITYAHQSRLAGMINHDVVASPFLLGNRKINVILIHEGIQDIPDTRTLLLDFGLDGVPGTGDLGEGNGIVDEGERLDEEKLTYFNQKQTGVHFSTAWTKGNWSVGLGIKGLHHSLAEHSGLGIGLDGGILTEPWENGRWGITVTDITTSWLVWDNGTLERQKPKLTTGIAHKIKLKNIPLHLTGMASLEVDLAGRVSDEDFHWGAMGSTLRVGVNLVYDYKVALRIGRGGGSTLAGGLGLSWRNVSLDYAFQGEPERSGLGTSHYISFAVSPQWIKNVTKKSN